MGIVQFLIAIGLGLVVSQAFAESSENRERVRKVILKSQRFGPHGMGYNMASVKEMSLSLSATDLPVLFELYGKPSERHDKTSVRVGVKFALVSLCQDWTNVAMRSVRQNIIDDMDAIDSLGLIADSDHCDANARAAAEMAALEVKKFIEVRNARMQKQRAEEQKNDQRIQQNGLKMLDPQMKKTLSRQEREEAFQRSVKAMGLDGPRTPAQENLYNRMYESMVNGK